MGSPPILVDAAVLALKAGVDIDMMADAYRKGLADRARAGARDDRRDRRVRAPRAAAQGALGLFDDPYRRGATAEPAAVVAERRALARDVARRAVVMLKNERDTLPLSAATKALCVIGPLADASAEMKGPWWGAGEHEPAVSVLGGLRAALPQTRVRHATGVDIEGDDEGGIEAAVTLCEGVDAVVLCLGERASMSGEAASRATPALPGRQQALAEAVMTRAHALGIPSSRSCSRAAPSSSPGCPNTPMRCWLRGSSAPRPGMRWPTWLRAGFRPAVARR
jgi:beta-glucosidase